MNTVLCYYYPFFLKKKAVWQDYGKKSYLPDHDIFLPHLMSFQTYRVPKFSRYKVRVDQKKSVLSLDEDKASAEIERRCIKF